jgi:hypothetical protein
MCSDMCDRRIAGRSLQDPKTLQCVHHTPCRVSPPAKPSASACLDASGPPAGRAGSGGAALACWLAGRRPPAGARRLALCALSVDMAGRGIRVTVGLESGEQLTLHMARHAPLYTLKDELAARTSVAPERMALVLVDEDDPTDSTLLERDDYPLTHLGVMHGSVLFLSILTHDPRGAVPATAAAGGGDTAAAEGTRGWGRGQGAEEEDGGDAAAACFLATPPEPCAALLLCCGLLVA